MNAKKLLVTALVGSVMALATGCFPEFPPEGNGGRPGHERPEEKDKVELKVKYGGEATYQDLSITLVDVPDDSRCPVDAQCVWAGNARVQLVLKLAQGNPTQVELNTHDSMQRSVEFEGYTITLADLHPYPVLNSTIDPRDYVATLQIVKK